MLKNKRLGMHAEVSDHLPEVYCDRTRIRQVILNLVSNAARFTEEGEILVRIAEQAGRAVVSVTDTGPGIPEEDAKNIFEPFWQGSRRLWRDKGGSGLGLSVSRQFVELHGGRIWFESEPGVGTTFSFDLPISPPITPTAGPGRWVSDQWVWLERASRTSLPAETFRPRMIVCDQTGDLQPALARYSDQIEFVATADLDQTVRIAEECPAQALMINAASTRDLWPLVEEATARVPDTLVIGCAVPRQLGSTLDAGASGYLVKPVTRTNLQAVLHSAGGPVRRVLVVDDDPDFVQLLTRMLHACNGSLEVGSALNGDAALNALRHETFDLMLLDVVMPKMDGWQVLELKMRDPELRDIPVVLLSAQDPTGQPLTAQALLTTTSGGLSLSKLVRCSLGLSSLWMQPD